MGFHSKVVGVSFEGRQKYVRQTQVNEQLTLQRDYNNPYDRNAIKVINASGNQIGFISKELAENMARSIDMGIRYTVTVSSITGTNPGDTMGVNIFIQEI